MTNFDQAPSQQDRLAVPIPTVGIVSCWRFVFEIECGLHGRGFQNRESLLLILIEATIGELLPATELVIEFSQQCGSRFEARDRDITRSAELRFADEAIPRHIDQKWIGCGSEDSAVLSGKDSRFHLHDFRQLIRLRHRRG